jgi:hypothetical protein
MANRNRQGGSSKGEAARYMKTHVIVIYSSSQKISGEVEGFIKEAQDREGGAGKVFRVHNEVYHPYLVFCGNELLV